MALWAARSISFFSLLSFFFFSLFWALSRFRSHFVQLLLLNYSYHSLLYFVTAVIISHCSGHIWTERCQEMCRRTTLATNASPCESAANSKKETMKAFWLSFFLLLYMVSFYFIKKKSFSTDDFLHFSHRNQKASATYVQSQCDCLIVSECGGVDKTSLTSLLNNLRLSRKTAWHWWKAFLIYKAVIHLKIFLVNLGCFFLFSIARLWLILVMKHRMKIKTENYLQKPSTESLRDMFNPKHISQTERNYVRR